MNHNDMQDILEYYRQQLRKGGVSISTRRTYLCLVHQFLQFIEHRQMDWRDLSQAKMPELLSGFVTEAKTEAGSLTTQISAIRHFLNTVGVPWNSTALRHPLTQEQLSLFLDAARRDTAENRTIAFLFASTGIRLNEAVELNRNSFEYVGTTLCMTACRLESDRQIPLNRETQDTLEEFLAIRTAFQPETDAPLWLDRNDRRLSMRGLSLRVRSIGWAANLLVTPAILRLTRLAQLAQNNQDADTLTYLGMFSNLSSGRRVIKEVLKHSSIDSCPAQVETAPSVAQKETLTTQIPQ